MPFEGKEQLKYVDSVAAHYLKPMPHIASVEVDFKHMRLVMRGTQEPLSEALDYLQSQFDEKKWDFPEAVNFHPYDLEPMKESSHENTTYWELTKKIY